MDECSETICVRKLYSLAYYIWRCSNLGVTHLPPPRTESTVQREPQTISLRVGRRSPLTFDSSFLILSGSFLAAFRRFAGSMPPESYHVTSITWLVSWLELSHAFWQLSAGLLAACWRFSGSRDGRVPIDAIVPFFLGGLSGDSRHMTSVIWLLSFPPACWQLSGGVLAAFWQRS